MPKFTSIHCEVLRCKIILWVEWWAIVILNKLTALSEKPTWNLRGDSIFFF
jgi:hypothetical protein